jgi:predicted RecA/RadA family phage recombinase
MKVQKFNGEPVVRDYTPVGAVTAGDVIVLNGFLLFAILDIAAGVLGAVASAGAVWFGAKDASVFADGDEVYWNPAGNPVVGTAGTGAFTNAFASGYTFAGYASAAALTGDAAVQFIKVAGALSALRTVAGQAATVTASDTIVTGLTKVVGVVATLDSDPGDDPQWATASIGDQAGAPAAGSFLLKTWKNTAGNDPTPLAATTFAKKVNWIAFGF